MIPPPTAPGSPAPTDSPFAASTPKAGGGGKKNMPPPQDYQAANAAQTKANRPDQTNAFGTSSQWHQNPDGTWTQSSTFGGGLGTANQNYQDQLAAASATPLDFGSLPGLDYGQQAFDKASNAAYGQETSRLDPMWAQREEQQRSQLAAQGLDPGSEAFTKAMGDFNRGRNDAYQSALNSSIGLGQSAAGQMFNQSSAARNQRLSEMLLGRQMPLQMLQGLGQFTGQSGVSPDQGLQAAGMQGAQDWMRYLQQQQQQADLGGGIGGLIGTAAQILPFFL